MPCQEISPDAMQYLQRRPDWGGSSAHQSEATLVAPRLQGCGWSSSPASTCLESVLTLLVIFGNLQISLHALDA